MGKLLKHSYRGKAKLAKDVAMRKRRLALAPLRLKYATGAPLITPVIQYRTFDVNSSYLISTLPSHTWSYTLPDLVVGSYIRMVSGVFMQKGGMLTMLKLFKGFKGLTGCTPAAQSSYKIIEPSFSAQVNPTVTNFKKKPLSLVFYLSTVTRLKDPQRSRVLSLPRPHPKVTRASASGKKAVLRVLGFRKRPLRALGLAPLLKHVNTRVLPKARFAFGAPLAFNTTRANFSYPKQNSLAVWNLLYQQPLLNYSLKYCRLSRRVRKILKNKYRYSKYYFVIAPYKRRLFTLHL
jgi:hypothetical protein